MGFRHKLEEFSLTNKNSLKVGFLFKHLNNHIYAFNFFCYFQFLTFVYIWPLYKIVVFTFTWNKISKLKQQLGASHSLEMCSLNSHMIHIIHNDVSRSFCRMGCIPEDVVISVGAIGCEWLATYLSTKVAKPATSSFNLYKSCN
jgi:hypothetical protein